MKRYQSSFALDEDTCQELAPFFWTRRRTWLYWTLSAAISVTSLVIGWTCHSALFFLVLALCFVPTPGTKRSFCRRAVRRHLYGVSSWGRIESFFTEEDISVRNLATCEQGVIHYQAVVCVEETEHYFFLRLRYGQWYALVRKDCLTPEERAGFLPFLQERCQNIKAASTW